MKKRWLALSLSCLALIAYTRLGSAISFETPQTVDGTQLDVQSLTTGQTDGKKTIKSYQAVATVSDKTAPPALEYIPVKIPPMSSIAPAGPELATTTRTADNPDGNSGSPPMAADYAPVLPPGLDDLGDINTGAPPVAMPGAGGVPLPGAPPAILPTRVAPLVYEVAERRPDFIYRPGRLDFQAQSTYDGSQTGLAVGPGVRPGTTRFVPVGNF